MISIQGIKKTTAFRKITLLDALKLEIETGLRMTNKMPSAYSIIKKEFGFKGNKKFVYQQFFFKLVQEKILVLKK